MKRNFEKGITLVALVITIVVLIIIAGITISKLLENGLIEKAKLAEKNYNNAQEKEKEILNDYANKIDLIEKEEIIDDSIGIIGKVSKIKESGYFTIQAKGKTLNMLEDEMIDYNVHTIVYNGNMILDGVNKYDDYGIIYNNADKTYSVGDKTKDVATANQEAQYMVILKIIGNLEINENIILTACKSDLGYGGPKGMFIYCTGQLTNNGEISMTARGAKATGQNVYLWKNTDNTYEYIPAVGGAGGVAKEGHGAGNKGTDGQKRQTGGGGSGGAYRYNTANAKSGAGGNGTSYSGGTGGGGSYRTYTAGSGAQNGGAGGNAIGQWDYANGAGGGAGNPGGTSTGGGSRGGNGTGGLLIIYSDKVINNGKITSNGQKGAWGDLGSGGSSGGGSINIFYNTSIIPGNINVDGGAIVSGSKNGANGSYGGKGTKSIGKIDNGMYTDFYENNE